MVRPGCTSSREHIASTLTPGPSPKGPRERGEKPRDASWAGAPLSRVGGSADGRGEGGEGYPTVFLNARALPATRTTAIASRAATCSQRSANEAPRMMMPREIAMKWVAGRIWAA